MKKLIKNFFIPFLIKFYLKSKIRLLKSIRVNLFKIIIKKIINLANYLYSAKIVKNRITVASLPPLKLMKVSKRVSLLNQTI